ncbi:hypothetical protein LSAT2_031925 [Lamellibrachia satsuma]|nr:hypothetical protein LSAT2_031925 [Lamellibrachia satsuma]
MLSFYCSRYSRLGGDDYLSAAEAKEKALSSIERAIEIFKEGKETVIFPKMQKHHSEQQTMHSSQTYKHN